MKMLLSKVESVGPSGGGGLGKVFYKNPLPEW